MNTSLHRRKLPLPPQCPCNNYFVLCGAPLCALRFVFCAVLLLTAYWAASALHILVYSALYLSISLLVHAIKYTRSTNNWLWSCSRIQHHLLLQPASALIFPKLTLFPHTHFFYPSITRITLTKRTLHPSTCRSRGKVCCVSRGIICNKINEGRIKCPSRK